MRDWLNSLLHPIHAVHGIKKNTKRMRKQTGFRPTMDSLEERLTPSTASSITGSFNGTSIAAGNTIWFSSVLKVSGVGSAPVTLHVENGAIDFAAGGMPYHVNVPNAVIVITPGATSVSSTFDP